MGTESNLQAYWQAGAFYLAVTIALLLVLNWVIIGALAEHPACKAKLRKVALTDAIFFAFTLCGGMSLISFTLATFVIPRMGPPKKRAKPQAEVLQGLEKA